MNTTFQGEMQLAGWSESHNGGCKVTFWLPSTEDLDAFRTLTVKKGNTAGHRFMAALVEIGDDEKPVEPEKPKGGPLSKLAGVWCTWPLFWEWINSEYRAVWETVSSEDDAAGFVRWLCVVDSRAKLDSDEEAAKKFHNLIRIPFTEYMKAQDRATQ